MSAVTCKQRIAPSSPHNHHHHHHIPSPHHPSTDPAISHSDLSASAAATPDLSRYPCTFLMARVPHPSSVQPSATHNSQSAAALRHKPRHLLRALLMWGFFMGLTANLPLAAGCGPGTGAAGQASKRLVPTIIKPLAIWARVPPMSELTYGASGPAEGPIQRNTDKFHKLKVNENSQISFDSDDARRMNLRCQTLLNQLAGWTAMKWGKEEGRLKVQHGWRPLNQHDDLNEEHRLHYEGRAIDITMNIPSESTDLGELAALAVQIGFDYVHYRGDQIHCSCVSEQYSHVYPKGCFSGNSLVAMSDGTTLPVSDLVPGDHVLSFDAHGNVRDDIFLTFLDRRSEGDDDDAKVISIVTEDGHDIRLTPNHLIFIHDDVIVVDNTTTQLASGMARFAGRARVGQYLYRVEDSTGKLAPSRIVTVSEMTASDGLYAPLTYSGRILVEKVAASCYAVVECETCAHYVLHPVRLYYYIKLLATSSSATTTNKDTRAPSSGSNSGQVTMYMRFLHYVASWVVPDKLFWASQL